VTTHANNWVFERERLTAAVAQFAPHVEVVGLTTRRSGLINLVAAISAARRGRLPPASGPEDSGSYGGGCEGEGVAI
jgi:hypothetical protein